MKQGGDPTEAASPFRHLGSPDPWQRKRAVVSRSFGDRCDICYCCPSASCGPPPDRRNSLFIYLIERKRLFHRCLNRNLTQGEKLNCPNPIFDHWLPCVRRARSAWRGAVTKATAYTDPLSVSKFLLLRVTKEAR